MFETHKLNKKGIEEVEKFKSVMSDASEKVLRTLPESREKSIFITKLEEAMFFGTKAVASKEGNYESIVVYSETPGDQG